MDVRMKRMETRMYSEHKAAMDTYNKMLEDETAAMEEKKAEIAAGLDAGNVGKGQAKGLGFFGANAEELMDQRVNMTCKANKNHRFRSCLKCSGCLKDNCGKCAFCLDMPKFGGAGTRRQKCETRKCVKPRLGACVWCTWSY